MDILVETPNTEDIRTTIKPDKIDEFTAQLAAMKAFFMNDVFELNNGNARLKKAFLNGVAIFLKKILVQKI